VSVALGGRYYVAAPEGGPEWGVRLGITFIFSRWRGDGDRLARSTQRRRRSGTRL